MARSVGVCRQLSTFAPAMARGHEKPRVTWMRLVRGCVGVWACGSHRWLLISIGAQTFMSEGPSSARGRLYDSRFTSGWSLKFFVAGLIVIARFAGPARASVIIVRAK
jgi:hypothetical protein